MMITMGGLLYTVYRTTAYLRTVSECGPEHRGLTGGLVEGHSCEEEAEAGKQEAAHRLVCTGPSDAPHRAIDCRIHAWLPAPIHCPVLCITGGDMYMYPISGDGNGVMS